MKLLPIFILLMSLFSSCKQEEVLTTGQRITQELQILINKENITAFQARRIDEVVITTVNASDYEFVGESIRMGSRYYNLNQMIKYYVSTYQGQNDKDEPMLVIMFNM